MRDSDSVSAVNLDCRTRNQNASKRVTRLVLGVDEPEGVLGSVGLQVHLLKVQVRAVVQVDPAIAYQSYW